jgi:hypothetical protein
MSPMRAATVQSHHLVDVDTGAELDRRFARSGAGWGSLTRQVERLR